MKKAPLSPSWQKFPSWKYLLCLLAQLGAACLSPDANPVAQTPFFKQRAIRELGNVHLTTVVQDNQGWIWLGAQEGLYRYDGLAFQSVKLPDSLPPSPVTAISEAQGKIWIGFKNGNICYVSSNSALLPASAVAGSPATELSGGVMLWQPNEGLPKKKITGFADDGQGGFWIATYGEGVYCYKNNRLFQFDAADDHLASNDVYALTCDGEHRIWAGTDGGISICTMPTVGRKHVANMTTAQGLPDEIVTALTTDVKGNVIIGTYEKGVCWYDLKKRAISVCTPDWAFGQITALATFGTSEIWAGTQNEGLIRTGTQPGTMQTLPDHHPLRHSKTLALFKDRECLLWDICDKGGVYTGNVRFGMLETPFQEIQTVFTDCHNTLWAGTPNGLFVKEQNKFRPILPQPENVLSIWEAPDGNIWVGTFGNGVYVIRPEGTILRHITERDGLVNGSILSISGNGEHIWIASLGGVITADPDISRSIRLNHENELGSSYVYKVFCDSRNRMWFGTDGKGLVMLENNQFKYFTEAAGVRLKTIYAITEDHHGKIWFSTHKDGLFCFDGSNFKRFTTTDHLHSMAITGLTVDGNNQMIVAYEDGVDLINPDRKDHVFFCDARIGNKGIDVNLNALCRDTAGNIWLGGTRDIMRIAAFKETFLDDPQPGITSVSVFLKPIDFQAFNTLAYNQNYLIFNFTGLWYTDPESVRYRYRLEDFDPVWKISKDHLASYPSLPPGHYTFRVQTSEHGNFDHVPEVSWSFTIEKPYWMTWWFRLLCLIALGTLVFGYIRIRERRLRREATLKREKVESQFAALKSQINPHFLFNSFNTLITIIEENPKVAVEYVEHLSDFYRSIIVYRERDLIPLEEEMEIVENFDFLLKKRFEDSYHLKMNISHPTGLIMPLTMQMLVENAVKHNVIAATKPLTVEISLERGDYVVVRNNIQRKIKAETGTHFGLQSLVHRYQLLGERPVLIEENSEWFTVKVPLIRNPHSSNRTHKLTHESPDR